MSVGAIMAGAAFVKLTIDDSSLQQGLNRAQKKIEAFKASAQIAFTELATVFTAVNVPVIGAVRAFGAFDDRMRMVQAVTGATGQAFVQLTEQAKRLGAETAFTAAQVSEGMLALGRMGLNPKEIEDSIRPMMNLSQVTGTELGQAAEIAANNMRVFGLEASKMSYVADILSVTANSSAQTLVDLGESLKMAGPHAKRAGADLTETAAALGILANMGIRGSLAGTALGKSYKRLADPKVIEFLKQYGVETLNADGSMRKMRDTLVDIAKSMKSMTNAEQITFAEEVFDARGSLGGGTLSINTEGIDLLMEKLKNSEGAAQRAADVMENGIGGTLRRMSSAAEGVSLAFGEMLSVSLMPLINMASSVCDTLRNIIKENAGIIGSLSTILYLGLGLGAIGKILFIIYNAATKIISPMVMIIKYLDGIVSGTTAAAKAAAVKAAQSATAVANAEKLKELAKTRSDAVCIASENRRHYMELKNAAASARAREIADGQKLAAAKARLAQETALNERARYQYTLATGSSKGFQTLPGMTQAQSELKAQEAAMAKSVATTKQSVAAASAARTATLQSAAAAKTASVAYAREAAAQAYSSRASTVYGAALGQMNAKKLFSAALSQKHAKTVLSASLAEMVAAKRGAGASTIKVAGYYAEAIAAKVAAGATVALGMALNFISKHPVLIALTAICALLTVMSIRAENAKKALQNAADGAKELADKASSRRESGDARRNDAKVSMKRLKQLEELSKKGKATAEDMKEAERLMSSLGVYGSESFASVDKLGKSISLTADAQERFNQKLQETAKIDLESELRETQNAIDKLNEQARQYNTESVSAVGSLWRLITGEGDENGVEETRKLGNEIEALSIKKAAAFKRLNALKKGEQDAVSSGGKTEAEITAERVEEAERSRQKAIEDFASAKAELAKLEEDNAKRKRSQYEQEILDIDKLKKRYAELSALKIEALKAELAKKLEIMAKTEKDWSREKYNKASSEASAIEQELYQTRKTARAMSKDFDAQRAEADAKEKARIEKDARPYDNFLADFDSKNAKEKDLQTEDNDFSEAMKSKDYDGAYNVASNLYATLASTLAQARDDYNAKLTAARSADSENGVDLSEAERSVLDELKSEISEASSRAKLMSGRMNEAREAAAKALETPDGQTPVAAMSAAWTVAGLESMLGGGTAADRTAAATEKSVTLQNNIHEKRYYQRLNIQQLSHHDK